jgi:hypothetical protein
MSSFECRVSKLVEAVGVLAMVRLRNRSGMLAATAANAIGRF